MRRIRMPWLVGLVGLCALACASCGVRPSGAIPGDPAPTGPVYGAMLYFVRHDEVIPTLRATTDQFTPAQAITLLASGPDGREQSDGLSTAVPVGIVPVTVVVDGSGSTLQIAVNPNSLSTMAVSQLTCTALTAIADSRVPRGSAPGNGFYIAGQGTKIGPLRCSDSG